MPSDELPEVELHAAYMWDCPGCGREGFVRAVSRVLDVHRPADRAAIERYYGPDTVAHLRADPLSRVVTQSYPGGVTCDGCGVEYASTDPILPTTGEGTGGTRRSAAPFFPGGLLVLMAAGLLFFAGFGLASFFFRR